MKAFWALLAIVAVMGVGYLVSTAMARKVRADLDKTHKQVANESASIDRRVQDALAAAEAPKPEPAPAPAPQPEAAKPAETPKPTEAPKDAATPEFEIAPGKIEKRDDGSLLIDARFPIKGEGTSESPYVISWELLLTSQPTFDPKAKKRKIPQGVAMLDGKVVRLAGFVAFPLNVQQPRELLSMLNQWDGCCIGVPPTPYDAVEVRLKKTVSGDARFATSGTVQGIFRVKPYTVGDWLVGLYMLDSATLEPREYGGFGK